MFMSLTEFKSLKMMFSILLLALAIIGYFLARLITTIDDQSKDIEALKINTAVMQNDMTSVKARLSLPTK